jgi:hypothetical protein
VAWQSRGWQVAGWLRAELWLTWCRWRPGKVIEAVLGLLLDDESCHLGEQPAWLHQPLLVTPFPLLPAARPLSGHLMKGGPVSCMMHYVVERGGAAVQSWGDSWLWSHGVCGCGMVGHLVAADEAHALLVSLQRREIKTGAVSLHPW